MSRLKAALQFSVFSLLVACEPALAGFEVFPANVRPVPEWSQKSAIVMTAGNAEWLSTLVGAEWLDLARSIAKASPLIIYTKSEQAANRIKSLLRGEERISVRINENHSSVWVRDFAPIWVKSSVDHSYSLIDLTYPRLGSDDDRFPSDFARDIGLSYVNGQLGNLWALAGGNFQSDDSARCFLTDLHGKAWIRKGYSDLMLKFGCSLITFLESVPTEKTGHLDMFMLALPNMRAFVSEYRDPKDREIQVALDRNYVRLEEQGYELIKIPAAHDGATHYSYTNTVLIGKTAIVPQYGITDDAEAIQSYEKAGFNVLAVSSKNLIRLRGALHCLTSYVYQ